MTQDEILRMAVKCQLLTTSNRDGLYAQALEAFAELVAEKAIKEALAQPTPAEYAMGYAEGFNDGCKPKPEQEPVAWGFQNSAITGSNRWMMLLEDIPANDQYGGALWTPLYTTPPPRTWVGLFDTDEGVSEIAALSFADKFSFAKAIEAKLRDKNNA
jgi:hypothetical protein